MTLWFVDDRPTFALHFQQGGVMTRRFIFLFCLFAICLLTGNQVKAQTGTVQVSGQVYDEDGETALPYAHVLSSKWATTTNVDGLFKVPLERDDTIRISFVGFKDYRFAVPEGYDDEYSTKITMVRDTIYLREAVIFFLPENEEEFKEAIIALKLDDREYDYALRNIALLKRQLRVINYDKDEFNAAENARYYLSGPQPVYFNIVFDRLRAAMRKGRRRKNAVPELADINPSEYATENNLVGISEADQKAFADSVRIRGDSTFYLILREHGKKNRR